MDWIIQIFGRFHPLVVHLPIGILFLAFLFECLSRFERFKGLESAVQPSLLFGSIFAVVSIVTGLFLSQEGSYDDVLLQQHQNIGIATAVFTVILYFVRLKSIHFFRGEKKIKAIRIFLFVPLVVLLSLTGHLGGSMTHGEDYLFESLMVDEQISDPMDELKTMANTDDAVLYTDIIEPILNSKCYSCHSSKKRKGDLRLDGVEFILQGGKHGAVVESGLPDSSSLYSRLMLPMEDEHHMPPNERPQLSSAEISLLNSWIAEGASFDKKVNSFTQAGKIKSYIGTLIVQLQQEPLIPAEEVPVVDANALSALQKKGVLILPLGHETNYLSVTFVNARSITDADLSLLLPLKKQLLWLNLGRTKITNEGLQVIAQLSTLRQIHLDHTLISDEGIKHLMPLTELNYLNLVSTKITDRGLSYLSSMTKLKNLYVYQTDVTAKGLQDLSAKLPDARIDTGGYTLPQLASDTIVFKRKV
jgi:uncharacterized membrane protein